MATLATNVSFQCFDSDGKPLAGGKVYTYSAGTTTSKATYTTMAGTVANPNPVILDQNGEAKIFLSDGCYRLQVKESKEALIQDIDHGIMECKYLHGSFVWYSKNGSNIKLMNYIPNIEVIGNIYENPELLLEK